jgi:hypothetical protein
MNCATSVGILASPEAWLGGAGLDGNPPCVVAENCLLRSGFEGLGRIVPFEELVPSDGIRPAP